MGDRSDQYQKEFRIFLKPIVYSTGAEADQNSALRGYYKISAKLAERLHERIKNALNNIHAHPNAWPLYFETFAKSF